MKIRIAGLLICAAAAAAAFTACTQAKTDCTVAKAGSGYGYAARYTLKSGTGACAELKGDIIGMENYAFVPGETEDKVDRDPNQKVAIQSKYMGELLLAHGPDTRAENKVYSLGRFTSLEPDDENFCTVDDISLAEQSYPAIPDDPETPMMDGVASTTVRHEWSNVRIYVTAGAPGTQISADLRFTQDDCTAEYHVVGVWPSVDCGVYDDANGDGINQENELTGIDETLCSAEADPENGRPFGSGINPDFPTVCDPVLHYCLLTGEPPQLNVTLEE